jgi:hypothetical protein
MSPRDDGAFAPEIGTAAQPAGGGIDAGGDDPGGNAVGGTDAEIMAARFQLVDDA